MITKQGTGNNHVFSVAMVHWVSAMPPITLVSVVKCPLGVSLQNSLVPCFYSMLGMFI